MTILACALAAVIFMLLLYVAFIRRQLRSINRQLDKRLSEHTRQPIRLELQSGELNALAVNMNKCLKAEETLRLKGIREEKSFKELIANISHDLRTPLTAIKGYQQLAMNGELTADQRKKLLVAQKHADELERLIEQFFEYSYLLNANAELRTERINLTNLVAECLAASVPALEERRLAVQLEDAPPVWIHADKEMATRIVQNLLRNCLQHAAGDIDIRLHAAGKAVLSIRNLVDPSTALDADRLFDRFYTGDKARSGSSTGLGLSIVRLLTDKMGGAARAALDDGMLEIRVELPLELP
ncbi:sensor histidine kinase [Paenibacillus arenilitoris]|nr:HAMP domain-containing sensor histidine kinase [Paenibacillus arenilitoris]